MFRIAIIKRISTTGTKKETARSLRRYSKQSKPDLCPPPPASNTNSGVKYTIGALAVISGATLGYAKYDPQFRSWLTNYVPITDDVLKFVFQEDASVLDKLKGLLNFKKSSKKEIDDQKIITYTPPPAAFAGVKPPPEEKYKEVRLECKEDEDSETTFTIVNQKPGGDDPSRLPDTHPKNIEELETNAGEAVSDAIQWYNRAANAVKKFNKEVEVVVEYSVNRVDQRTWDALRNKSKEKQEALKEAERCAEEALKDLKKLKELLERKDLRASNDVKRASKKNIERLEKDIQTARKNYENEMSASSITEKYWEKVENARKHFMDELEILFPSIKIQEKKLQLSPEELDLFILHAFSNVLFYQKELARSQTLGEKRIQDAITRGDAEELANAKVQQLLEKEKQKLFLDYEKRCLCLRNESERDLKRQLKLQSAAFADHLDDAVKAKEMELIRDINRKTDEKLQKEHEKYKKQLAAIVGRLKGMDLALKAQQNQERITRKAQSLWGACQALYRTLRSSCPSVPWHEQLRSLKPEISAIQNAADPQDEFVCVVLHGLPPEASDRGVFTEEALRERFLKVEKIARQMSLVPESGANLPLYLLSFLQSAFLLKTANPIPQAELDDKPTDFSKLSTNDILQRSRYWLDRGDFAQALKYMNLLKGASRSVAKEWMNEARIFLETQQAATSLMAHAVANGLAVL